MSEEPESLIHRAIQSNPIEDLPSLPLNVTLLPLLMDNTE
jgi:hypothetical protein